MQIFKEVIYIDLLPTNIEYFLVADIGGTNSNFGITALLNDEIVLFVSIHLKSNQIKDFNQTFIEIIKYIKDKYNIEFKKCCIAAAGVIEHTYIKPTNLNFKIDAQVLKTKTNLQTIELLNDFQAAAYGIDKVSQESLITIQEGKKHASANKALLGAGTGLGKAILYYDKLCNSYIPLQSEGGHTDFACQNDFELKLAEFLKQESKENICSWETVLSGHGISNIYKFLKSLKKFKESSISKEIDESNFAPNLILSSWQNDELCNQTFKLYAKFYGRCAKNFVLESLSLAGIFIAGGIAANNIELFKQPEFLKEFLDNNKLGYLLKEIPVTVIADYNIGLYGATYFLVST